MNFLGLGPGELLLIMILAMIVFGPQKLPEIGAGVGKAIREFRKATTDITQEINRELSIDLNAPSPPGATPAPAVEGPQTVVEEPQAAEATREHPVPEAADAPAQAAETTGESPVLEADAPASPEKPEPTPGAVEPSPGPAAVAMEQAASVAEAVPARVTDENRQQQAEPPATSPSSPQAEPAS